MASGAGFARRTLMTIRPSSGFLYSIWVGKECKHFGDVTGRERERATHVLDLELSALLRDDGRLVRLGDRRHRD